MDKILLIGHLGRDPELRYTPDGAPVAHFTVAANRHYGNTPVWYRVTVWRRLAEVCAEYLHKGQQIYLEGELQADECGNPRTFTRKDGTPGAAFELTADKVEFLSGNDGGKAAGDPPEDAEELPF